MYKVLAICGSRRKKGNTISLLKQMQEAYLMLSDSVAFELLTPLDYSLLPSETPEAPFLTGKDLIETMNLDDTLKLKDKLSRCNLAILASPTYYAAVSSDFKLLVDRFCYLAHLFYFSGKPCQTVVTSDGNGHSQVSNYIRMFCDGLGMVRIDEVVKTKGQVLTDQEMKKIAQNGMDAIITPSSITPSINMEILYRERKGIVRKQPDMSAERKYWLDSGLFACDSLQEYFDLKRG